MSTNIPDDTVRVPPTHPKIDRVLSHAERWGAVCVHCGSSTDLGPRFWVLCTFDHPWKVSSCHTCTTSGKVPSA
ncbi:hypothetical protein [Allostreptomyces psammosilenae]|uniref:Uncharacterized protein n=1 Tax=Allostreptomyces psammosilenae TaxID=1892865 RepID=A0A853A047_9ACTN|nr:hypothetical protein [Allostreptomyces psammosilenae]NYI03758.1 hypothetical protein [Allostreptomyces psammosilenae]